MKRKIIIATLSLLGVFLVAGTITIASTTTNTTTPKTETTTQSENFRFNADDEDFRYCHDDNTSMQKDIRDTKIIIEVLSFQITKKWACDNLKSQAHFYKLNDVTISSS